MKKGWLQIVVEVDVSEGLGGLAVRSETHIM